MNEWDWQRIATAVIARRTELGMRTTTDLARRALISARLLGDIENARRKSYAKSSLRSIERALGWTPGSIDEIGGGDTPTEYDPVMGSGAFLNAGHGHMELIASAGGKPRPSEVLIVPRTFTDARPIGEMIRNNYVVNLDLSEVTDQDAKRLIDFAAGASFAMRATIRRETDRPKRFVIEPVPPRPTEAEPSAPTLDEQFDAIVGADSIHSDLEFETPQGRVAVEIKQFPDRRNVLVRGVGDTGRDALVRQAESPSGRAFWLLEVKGDDRGKVEPTIFETRDEAIEAAQLAARRGIPAIPPSMRQQSTAGEEDQSRSDQREP